MNSMRGSHRYHSFEVRAELSNTASNITERKAKSLPINLTSGVGLKVCLFGECRRSTLI